jgi:hypothetical protein
MQDRFSWAGVAASVVGNSLGGAVGGLFSSKLGNVIGGTAGILASAATRSLIDGSDFGDNVAAALPDIVANTVGAMITEGVRAKSAAGDEEGVTGHLGKSHSNRVSQNSAAANNYGSRVIDSNGDEVIIGSSPSSESSARGQAYAAVIAERLSDKPKSSYIGLEVAGPGAGIVAKVDRIDPYTISATWTDSKGTHTQEIGWADHRFLTETTPEGAYSVDPSTGDKSPLRLWSSYDSTATPVPPPADSLVPADAPDPAYDRAMSLSRDYALTNPEASAVWAYEARHPGEGNRARFNGFWKQGYNFSASIFENGQRGLLIQALGPTGATFPVFTIPRQTLRPEERTGGRMFTSTTIATSAIAPAAAPEILASATGARVMATAGAAYRPLVLTSPGGTEPLFAAENAVPGGWNVGDDIYTLTSEGNEPAWSTVRSRFWKNEAASPQYGTWDAEQLDRLGRGLAPQRYNLDKGGIESMELSHEPIPFRFGGRDVVPRWPQDHAAVDPFRRPGY